MNKNKIMSDEKFRNQCSNFNLDFLNFSLYEYSSDTYLILVPTANSNITVLMDAFYNIVEFINDTSKETVEKVYQKYTEVPIFNNERDTFFGCAFCDISLKQINDFNNKIDYVTPKQVCENIEKDGDVLDRQYTQVASLIKFLGIEINNYYNIYYHFKLLNIDFIDINQYLRKIVTAIENCISTLLENGQRPFPIDVLEYLGINDESKYTFSLLHNIIEGFMQEKNMKSIPGSFNLVENAKVEVLETKTIEKIIKKDSK